MNLNTDRVPILLYHSIIRSSEYCDICTGTVKIFSISEDRFEEQMKYLYQQGYKTISPDELLDCLDKKILLPSKPVMLTFDDGCLSNYTIAYPILKKLGFAAIFFITTNWVGQSNRLTWENIKEMNSGGMKFGSHGVTHRYLSELNSDQITFELEHSKKILEEKIGTQINFLSIPGGHYSNKVKEIAKKVGYLAVCTSLWGTSEAKTCLFSLKRLGVKNNISVDYFIKLVEMDASTIRKEQAKAFIKNLAKKVLGINRYETIKENVLKNKVE